MSKERKAQLEAASSSPPEAQQPTPGALAGPAEEPKRKRAMNPEIQAMAQIDRIFADLDDETATRVLNWMIAKHNDEMAKKYAPQCGHGIRPMRMNGEDAREFIRHMMGAGAANKPTDNPSGGDPQAKPESKPNRGFDPLQGERQGDSH